MKKLYLLLLMASTGMSAQGSLCTDPIVVSALPYTTTDDTANYLDSYDPPTASSPTCSMTVYGNQYHTGNDVIYSYTSAVDGLIKAEIPAALAWTGMFIYTDCANIGINYAACATGPSAGARTINNFAVTAGQTIYIYISSWETPQTVAYTLNITDASLNTENFEQKQAVTVYPNPASDVLRVASKTKLIQATIYNTNGQRFNARLSADNEIAIDHLQSGFYMLEVANDEGTTIRTKFVKL